MVILAGGCAARKSPNVVLVIVDALRADHLTCYGYHRNTSPAIDSLADAGVRYTNVCSQSSWTLPSVTTIMTGLNVREHAAGRRGEAVYSMNHDLPILPLVLNRAGYNCAGIFNVYLLSEQFGFNRGFDSFSCEWLGHGNAGSSVDQAMEWISETDSSEPFFLVIHLFDPHDPYDPPPPYDEYYTPGGSGGITWWPFLPSGAPDNPCEYREHLMGLYDGEIAWTDSQLSRLFAFFRESGLAENTVVILTADHGEEFFEHNGFGHGKTMFREVLHVPLIIAGAGIPRDSVDKSLRALVDVFPTILDIASVDYPETISGLSLFAPPAISRAVPSSNVNSGLVPIVAAITTADRKLIWNAETGSAIMFSMTEDSLERNPLPPDQDLLDSVLFYWSTPPLMQGEVSDREMIESALRDLGYF